MGVTYFRQLMTLNRTLFYLIARVHVISRLQGMKPRLSGRRRAHEGVYNTFTCERDARVLTIRPRIRARWSIRLTTATPLPWYTRTPFNYPLCLCTSTGNIAPEIAQFVLTRIPRWKVLRVLIWNSSRSWERCEIWLVFLPHISLIPLSLGEKF